MKPEESKAIRELCDRHCSIDGEKGAKPDGYFRIDCGSNRKSARKAAASVPWSEDIDAVHSQLDRSIRSLETEAEADIWIRAIPAGETHPLETVRVKVDPTDDDPDDARAKGRGAEESMAWALVATNKMLCRNNEGLASQLIAAVDERGQILTKLALTTQYAAQLEDSKAAGALNDALEMLGPTMEAVGPILAAGAAAWMAQQGATPGAPVPTEGPPAVDHHMGAIERAGVALAALLQADPKLLTPELLVRVRAFISPIAPMVGFVPVNLEGGAE